jgi:hypothetical protein
MGHVMSRIIQLRKIIASLTEYDWIERPQRSWLGAPIERTRNTYSKLGKWIGLDSQGVSAFNEFVASVWSGSTGYQRGVSLNRLSQATLNIIADHFSERAPDSIGQEDVAEVINLVTGWISAEIGDRRHFIACGIIQEYANSFKIGPVSFQHLNDFTGSEERAAVRGDKAIESAMVHFWSHYAHWAATVDIIGCEAERSQELAELAVDLSLVGVQLVIPINYSRHMARKNARQVPAPIQNVSIADGRGHVEKHYYIAGMDWTVQTEVRRERFDKLMEAGDSTLQSIGHRVASFIKGANNAAGLEQAWCDSAYWFHEGLAEPLDAIAVPKLETAIEVLFRSANLTGSERRVLNAIRAFYGAGTRLCYHRRTADNSPDTSEELHSRPFPDTAWHVVDFSYIFARQPIQLRAARARTAYKVLN